jgi:lipopolysaccharide biosynthesis regulator YciM
MNQSLAFYYVGGAAVLVLILVALLASWVRRRRKKTAGADLFYIRALNALLDGDRKQAIQYFLESVRANTENVDAYVRLGDIFREDGKYDRAIKIHKELLVRRNIDRVARENVIRSLVKDYQAAGLYDKALEMLNELFSIEPKNEWGKQTQLAIYEAKEDWENAFKTLKTLSKWRKEPAPATRLALYRVKQAQKAMEEGREKEGRVRLREAIKTDPNCSAAYIALGDSYVREGRYTDAVKVWVDFVRKVPRQAYLVFDRLQEILYSIGSYSEIESLLEELHGEYPDIPEVALSLADIKLRKGEVDQAINLCESLLEKVPEALQVRMKLIQLYARKGDKEKALKLADDMAHELLSKPREFECSICHFRTEKMEWHCPKCRSWNSFVRVGEAF